MDGTASTEVGRVAEIWRHPVKSMLGERRESVLVGATGVMGDRSFALVDRETGKVASSKNPRRWPNLFAFRSTYRQPPGETAPAVVEITLPSGEVVSTDSADVEERLSEAVGRPVRLARTTFEGASAEGYWPDHDWLPDRDQTFEFTLPTGTFFDGALLHLVTTSTLSHLASFSPTSRFDPCRFRVNFVIEPPAGQAGFVEDGWIGRTLEIGDASLRVERPTPRCVMTTLPQGELPKDPAILRTAVQENDGNVGVYAGVIRGGLVRVGDPIRIS